MMRKCITRGKKRRVRLGEGRSTLKTPEAKRRNMKMCSSCVLGMPISFICVYEVVHNKTKTTLRKKCLPPNLTQKKVTIFSIAWTQFWRCKQENKLKVMIHVRLHVICFCKQLHYFGRNNSSCTQIPLQGFWKTSTCVCMPEHKYLFM